MSKKLLGAVVVGASVLLAGCAGFKANKLAQVSAEELKSSSAKKTKVFSRWTVETKSKNEQAKVMIAALHKKHFENAIASADCCILVEGPTEADVVIEGKAFDEANPAALIPAFITGLSLYTIPSWVTATTHISASVKNKTLSQSYELNDSMTLVQWLPMIVALPFKGSPFKAENDVAENTYKNLVLNMKKDGLIN